MIAPPLRPVQLCLELRTRAPGRRAATTAVPRPYWDHVDLADIGGELRAARDGVKALLTAERQSDRSWVGYHDLVLGGGGSSGSTRPQVSRQDALASAAYQMVKHCELVLAQNGTVSRAEAQAARQIVRWLNQLDVL